MLQPIAAYLNALLCVNHALHVCSYEDKPGSNPNLPDEEMHDNIVRYKHHKECQISSGYRVQRPYRLRDPGEKPAWYRGRWKRLRKPGHVVQQQYAHRLSRYIDRYHDQMVVV